MSRTETLDLAGRRFPTLSGGEAARVSLARILAQETPLLLLDEPTAHLDPRHQQATLSLARDLSRRGSGVLAVVHDLNLAAAYADRVALLHGGRLVASGAPWDLLQAPRLSAVFGLPFAVLHHPTLDCPLVVPLPGTERSEPACTSP
jgi:iron complex transport system ATP-binding protein